MKKIITSTLLVSAILIAGCTQKTNTDTANVTGTVMTGSESTGTVDTGSTVTTTTTSKKGADVKVAVDQKAQWVGEKIGTTHTGTVDIMPESMIQVNTQGNVLGGKVVVAMKTILEDETKEGGVTKHLLGEDFFDVENHPTAVIEVTSVDYNDTGVNTGSVVTNVTANLTIKGTTKVVTFPVTVTQDGDFLLVSAQLALNINDFKIGTSLLGKIALKDTFRVNFNNVTFTR